MYMYGFFWAFVIIPLFGFVIIILSLIFFNFVILALHLKNEALSYLFWPCNYSFISLLNCDLSLYFKNEALPYPFRRYV
jgi:hypothetical protein